MRIMNYGNDYAHRDRMIKKQKENVEERKIEAPVTEPEPQPEPEKKSEDQGEAKAEKGKKGRKS